MRVTILHTDDAAGPPEDPVLGQVDEALRAAGHETKRLAVAGQVPPLVEALTRDAPELVFNLAESFGGKSALESNVAALLNLLGLRYTGSSPAGLLLAGDKSLAKRILSAHAIRSPRSATLFRGALELTDELKFPLIVKPPQEDASIGITQKSIVRDVKELLQATSAMQAEFRSPVLVEEFVDGREFHLGVLGNARAEALPPIEMDFTALPAGLARIASWDAKWGDASGGGVEFEGTKAVFPTDLAEPLVEEMKATAVRAFHALRLRDYARVDLRVSEEGEVYVIEVNPNCYLEREAEFARAAAHGGMAHPALIARIAELAAARYTA